MTLEGPSQGCKPLIAYSKGNRTTMWRRSERIASVAIRRNIEALSVHKGIPVQRDTFITERSGYGHGIVGMITMVTLGQGATAKVTSGIAKLGSNMLMERPGQGLPGS
jgi:hypothetical protein